MKLAHITLFFLPLYLFLYLYLLLLVVFAVVLAFKTNAGNGEGTLKAGSHRVKATLSSLPSVLRYAV